MEDQESTHNRIKTHATQLFIKYGIKSVSIEDIVSSLHISKKTFYKSFLNKEVLIAEISNDSISELGSKFRIVRRNHQGLDQFLRLQYEFFKWSSKFSGNLIHDVEKYYPTILERYKKFRFDKVESPLIQLLADAKKEGHIIKSADVRLFCELQIKNMEDLIAGRWAPLQERETTDYFEQFIVNGLRGILNNFFHARFELESFRADIVQIDMLSFANRVS